MNGQTQNDLFAQTRNFCMKFYLLYFCLIRMVPHHHKKFPKSLSSTDCYIFDWAILGIKMKSDDPLTIKETFLKHSISSVFVRLWYHTIIHYFENNCRVDHRLQLYCCEINNWVKTAHFHVNPLVPDAH